ncbi:MAG: DUF883 domain-containing protein [Verrucomicrobiae bacterium]|nr:DUF883 domain-containing protein [Verrucomicrobiae bacterium]
MSDVVTKEKLIDDVKVVLHDADALLQETAGNLGEKAREARVRLEKGIKAAKERLSELQKQGVEQAKAAAKATDQFVNEHPWPSVGIAFAVGALIGLVIGRRS